MATPVKNGTLEPKAATPVNGSKTAQDQLETLAALYLGAQPKASGTPKFADYCLEQFMNGNEVAKSALAS
ncbi:hypothetical protein ACFPMF_18130 [Larkinella bovis]|uniref:Uncharacterized protein n=1 Tax=Larkinella bovis TaxID=683041 RepID=A0ABW0IFB4_9BACT